jgi:hypothetical protein
VKSSIYDFKQHQPARLRIKICGHTIQRTSRWGSVKNANTEAGSASTSPDEWHRMRPWFLQPEFGDFAQGALPSCHENTARQWL